jgi:hypothetical protein
MAGLIDDVVARKAMQVFAIMLLAPFGFMYIFTASWVGPAVWGVVVLAVVISAWRRSNSKSSVLSLSLTERQREEKQNAR